MGARPPFQFTHPRDLSHCTAASGMAPEPLARSKPPSMDSFYSRYRKVPMLAFSNREPGQVFI